MTKLIKPIKRETDATLFERSRRRQVIVVLEPPDQLGFRLKGTKRTYYLDAAVCYEIALQKELEELRRIRRLDSRKRVNRNKRSR
jgi:hypothetical protein